MRFDGIHRSDTATNILIYSLIEIGHALTHQYKEPNRMNNFIRNALRKMNYIIDSWATSNY